MLEFSSFHGDHGPVMTLDQSYVMLAVAIVVALTNFLGAYFAVRRARAKRTAQ